jgi:hypothetical protein
MIAPLLHAKSPVAPTTPATATRKAIPEWQLRKIQRELDLCRRLMHASREAARRSERDRKSTMPLFATRGGGTARGAPQTGHLSTERRCAPRIPGALR